MFDKIYINNCKGTLDRTVVDATSITPAEAVGTNKDITLNLPILLPPGNHPQFILNGPCLWFESWSDSSIKSEQAHIEFYLYEVLTVWQHNQRFNSPIGIIEKDCRIAEFDMIDNWCKRHNKTFSIYVNEYKMIEQLKQTQYANWPVEHLDTFSLGYGYPGHINTTQGADSHNIYKNIAYKWNCFTYRWDQHRMLIAGLLHENSDCVVTHYHKTVGTNIKWPFSHSRYYMRLINGKNSLNGRVPLSVESFDIPVATVDNVLPITREHLTTDTLEPFYLGSFGSVVCETNYEYPWGQCSEKSINPARYENAFVLLAGPNSLELLKHWGLKTFDRWWDESYDQEIDPVKRLDKVIDIVDSINKKSFEELTLLKADMAQVLLHNRNLFRSGEIKKNMIKAKR